MMNVQLVRNATLVITINHLRILVDPMLSRAGNNPPITNTPNERRNPLVELPFPASVLVANIDAVLVTHMHRDHFDDPDNVLRDHLPVFCQPEDVEKLSAYFKNVYPVAETAEWCGITITRTGGHHGTGEIGTAMGPVSGYVLQADGEPTLYIAGDTIWCEEVEQALTQFQPQITVVNASGARFNVGDPIVMTDTDVITVCQHAPQTQVIAVHLEAINHCLQTRRELYLSLLEADVLPQVRIPDDGETFSF